MRWTKKSKPESGAQRVISKFLWFPTTLCTSTYAGYIETRWLEKALIVQEYYVDPYSSTERWYNERWL